MHNDILIIKKNLNLPSFAVEFGNGNCLQGEVVGLEAIDSAVSKVLIDNESEIFGVLPGSVVAYEADKRRDGTVQVHQSMLLDSTFSVVKSRPRAERNTQLYGAAIKGANHLVKVYSQFLADIKVFRLLYQYIAYTPCTVF